MKISIHMQQMWQKFVISSNFIVLCRHQWFFACHSEILKGQVSRMTSILKVERSRNSCVLAVHRPLAYFRSANLNRCHVTQNIIRLSNFFWAMFNEPQISFGHALEVFQGQINVKVNVSHVAQNIVRLSFFLCELCLMRLKSVSVKLWRSFKAK